MSGTYMGIKDNTDLIDISKYTELWVVAAFFEPVGAAAGFLIATLLGMDEIEGADATSAAYDAVDPDSERLLY